MQKHLSKLTSGSTTSSHHWRTVQLFYHAAFRFSHIQKEIQTYGASKLVYSVAVPLTQYSDSPEATGHWTLLPSSRILTVWHYLMYLVLLWTAIVGTFVLCFLNAAETQAERLEVLLLVLCPLDLVVSFLSAYKGPGRQVVTSPQRIAVHYLRSWLALDLLASAGVLTSPCQQVLPPPFAGLLPYIVHLAQVMKLVKHSKQIKWTRPLRRAFGPIALRILRLLCLHLMMTHVLGCLWYFLARWVQFQPECWVVRYGYLDKSPLESYIASIYFIWTTLATVGTGDIAAYSQEERAFTVGLMLFGVGFLSYTISTASALLQNSEASELTRKLESVRDFAQTLSLSSQLVQEVQAHLRYAAKHESRNWQQELGNLPLFLAAELSLFMHHRLVAEVSFFQDKEPFFISEVFALLQVSALEEGKTVYKESSFPSEVYFLRKGRVDLLQQESVFVTYVQGSYFGELEMLWRTPRTSTARTQCATELLVLPKDHFLRVLDKYPTVRSEVLEIAHIRQARNTLLLKSVLGEGGVKSSSLSLNRKQSMRHLKQRENYRVNWKRLNSLENSLHSKWSSASKQTDSNQLISAGQVFVPSESQARHNIVRRKRRSVLASSMSETINEQQLTLSRRAMSYLAILRREYDTLQGEMATMEKEQRHLAAAVEELSGCH